MKIKSIILLFFLWVSLNGFTQVTEGLKAYYAFAGSTIDSSGNGYDATLAGNATTQGTLFIPYDVISYMSLPNNVMNQLQDFSVALWVRFNQFHTGSGSHYNTMLSGENNTKSGGDNFGIYYQKYISGPGGEWQMYLQDDYYLTNTDSILLSQWYFVVYVREGSNAMLYKNGTLRATATNVYSIPLLIEPNGLIAGQEQDAVGSDFNINQCLDGNIGKLRIYDRALNLTEIGILYNNQVGMIDIVSDQLSIYPNPTKGNLTISGLANSVNPTLEIYNTNGALIRSAILDGVFSSRISFELTGIENGLYYTRIRSGDKIYTMKFLLTR